MSTDPSRHEAAEAGERHEVAEGRRAGAADEHTAAREPTDPNAGVVRATPPGPVALLVAATTAVATLIVLIAAALAATGTA